jgi:hypothetical protein
MTAERVRDRLARVAEPAPPQPVDQAPSAAEMLGSEPSPREAAELILTFPSERAAVLQRLERAYGNAFVADVVLFLEQKPALPPMADSLRRFREGYPRLRSLVRTRPPEAALDLRRAVAWLDDVVTTLRIVEPLADATNLFFESHLIQGHDEEYSAAQSRIGPQLEATLKLLVPAVRTTGERVRESVIAAVNASSVAADAPAAEPVLASLAQATRWRELSTALAGLAPAVDRGGLGLQDAARVCEDAALAMLQARAVLELRDTWRSGAAVEAAVADADKAAPGGRARNEVDDIFADSGFGSQQTKRNATETHDWCGMFVAAGMFRASALDKDLRMAFAHTDNVHHFFRYQRQRTNTGRNPGSIWAEGRWWTVQEYHQNRGAMRMWAQEADVDTASIRPGDVLLIRHQGAAPTSGDIANHIVMVESFDAASRKLVTIEGNMGQGIRAGADGKAKRNAAGDLKSDAAAQDSSVVHIRDMADDTTLSPFGNDAAGAYREFGRRTVFGVGRPSIVDFENHEYGLETVPEEFKYLSPAEIRQRGQGALLQTPSRIESPASGPYHKRVG